MPQPRPIKRNPAIVQFSREHHYGLLLVWKIRQGLRLAVAPERIGRYVTFAFGIELEPHFQAEENLLLNRLPGDNDLKIQTEEEHRLLREQAGRLRETPDDAHLLETFAQTLENHIRFEERTLFNYLQEQFSSEILSAIEAAHPPLDREACELWADTFWKAQPEG